MFGKVPATVRPYLSQSSIVLPVLDLMSKALRIVLVGRNVQRQVTWTKSNIVTELRIKLGRELQMIQEVEPKVLLPQQQGLYTLERSL